MAPELAGCLHEDLPPGGRLSQGTLGRAATTFRGAVFSRSHPRGRFPCKPLLPYYSQWD
jgi:hypothetical protein